MAMAAGLALIVRGSSRALVVARRMAPSSREWQPLGQRHLLHQTCSTMAQLRSAGVEAALTCVLAPRPNAHRVCLPSVLLDSRLASSRSVLASLMSCLS